jgi:hypothetical protein
VFTLDPSSFFGGFLGAVAAVLVGVPATVFIASFWSKSPIGKAVSGGVGRLFKPVENGEPEKPAMVHPPTKRL